MPRTQIRTVTESPDFSPSKPFDTPFQSIQNIGRCYYRRFHRKCKIRALYATRRDKHRSNLRETPAVRWHPYSSRVTRSGFSRSVDVRARSSPMCIYVQTRLIRRRKRSRSTRKPTNASKPTNGRGNRSPRSSSGSRASGPGWRWQAFPRAKKRRNSTGYRIREGALS